MRRTVLDPGVLVSALITPTGLPAKIVAQADQAEFELIVSPMLLDELMGVLLREKFRRYVDVETVHDYLSFIRQVAVIVPDPDGPPPLRCSDPDDDYLISLAYSQDAVLVSGDSDLLGLSSRAPICSPADYVEAAST